MVIRAEGTRVRSWYWGARLGILMGCRHRRAEVVDPPGRGRVNAMGTVVGLYIGIVNMYIDI